jgi:hypothetical protein
VKDLDAGADVLVVIGSNPAFIHRWNSAWATA